MSLSRKFNTKNLLNAYRCGGRNLKIKHKANNMVCGISQCAVACCNSVKHIRYKALNPSHSENHSTTCPVYSIGVLAATS